MKKLVLAAAAGSAVAAGVWNVLPRLVTRPAFATEVRSAVRKANTWHFVGWRQHGDEKLKWEIWGRREPFFYREQVGDDVLIDDGRSRLRLLPPDRFQNRGYAVSLPSRRLPMTDPGGESGPQEQFIEGINGGYLDRLHEKGSDPSGVVYSVTYSTGVTREESLLTIDRRSRLPKSYRMERAEKPMLSSRQRSNSYAPPRTAAELAMSYNVAIPAEVLTLSPPAGFSHINAPDGLVLRPRAVGRDAAGNLHVRLESFLGGERFVEKRFPLFRASVQWQSPPFTQPRDARYPTDETGRRYLPVPRPANVYDGDSTDIWMVPVEPVTPGAAPPRALSLPVVAKLYFDKGIPTPYVRVTWTSVPLLAKATILSLPLPQAGPATRVAYDNQPTTKGLQVSGPVMPLAFEAAMARYQYFRDDVSRRGRVALPDSRESSRKALFWLTRAIEAAEKTAGAEKRAAELRRYKKRLDEELSR